MTKTTTQAITVTTINTTLNSNSWATIKAVSDAGKGDDYWDVGDTKTITINGTVQGFTFSNLSIAVFILGFNHNSSREGNNRIHFQIGKISNKLVGLCDSNYGSYVSSGFCMNTEQTNRGGWSNSHMRKTVLGNSGAPSSPPANSLLAALPADLRAVMKSVSKYSDNTGGGYDTASYVTATTDWLFLLAEFEYHGSGGDTPTAPSRTTKSNMTITRRATARCITGTTARERRSLRGPVPPMSATVALSALSTRTARPPVSMRTIHGAGPRLCGLIHK